MRTLTIPPREAEVILDVDVVVCGAGPAGLAAALAAARAGASVALLERYGFLGGNFTVASVGTMCGLYVRTAPGEFDHITGGIARSFADELAARGSAIGPYPFKDTAVLVYVPWAAKRLADHLITEGPASDNITLLLHALVSDVVVDPDTGDITGVIVASKQGPRAVLGAVVIDATGDADVAVHAGVPWVMGAPGERQFGSMQFFMQHVDVEAAMAAGLDGLAAAIAEHGSHLTRDGGAVIPTFRPGEVLGAMIRLTRDGEPLDGTDLFDLTHGELEGRRRAEEAAAFLQAHMPGFEDAFLADTATQQGVRETRHILGRYTLRGDDITAATRFDDAIALGAWPQEYHVHERSTEYRFLDDGTAYQIPYRCLLPAVPHPQLDPQLGSPFPGSVPGSGPASVPASVTRSGLGSGPGSVPGSVPGNLLVAGRCMSADHDALASCRVMAPCMALGEAAGTAAATAVRDGIELADLDTDELRDNLRAHGAIVSS